MIYANEKVVSHTFETGLEVQYFIAEDTDGWYFEINLPADTLFPDRVHRLMQSKNKVDTVKINKYGKEVPIIWSKVSPDGGNRVVYQYFLSNEKFFADDITIIINQVNELLSSIVDKNRSVVNKEKVKESGHTIKTDKHSFDIKFKERYFFEPVDNKWICKFTVYLPKDDKTKTLSPYFGSPISIGECRLSSPEYFNNEDGTLMVSQSFLLGYKDKLQNVQNDIEMYKEELVKQLTDIVNYNQRMFLAFPDVAQIDEIPVLNAFSVKIVKSISFDPFSHKVNATIVVGPLSQKIAKAVNAKGNTFEMKLNFSTDKETVDDIKEHIEESLASILYKIENVISNKFSVKYR